MDYFGYGRRRGNTVGQDRLNPPPPTPGTPGGRRPLAEPGSLENLRRNPASAIRISRLPSGNAVPQLRPNTATTPAAEDTAVTGRRRSSSEPNRWSGSHLAPPPTEHSQQRPAEPENHMPTITEGESSAPRPQPSQSTVGSYREAAETPQAFTPGLQTPAADEYGGVPASRVASASALNSAGNAARQSRGLRRHATNSSLRGQTEADARAHYNTDVVDFLDLVDPEVRTINTLTNVGNSLFVPDLGSLFNRRPTYNLSRDTDAQRPGSQPIGRTRTNNGAVVPPAPSEMSGKPEPPRAKNDEGIEMDNVGRRRLSISSNLSDSRYAVLPHGISLEGWSEEDKAELDDHVRHLLHSRREGFKRNWRGFKQYVSKPLGLFVTVYATLVTLFGAAWVFFLIGWVYVGSRQDYFIDVIDLTLVALFALMGDGLAPFRAVDTYHMCFIARYHHLTWRLRSERALPGLVDHNDLPGRQASLGELEDAIDKEENAEYSVLKPLQQKRLQYHQAKFSKSHTFYRPHETYTHHAFPLRLLVAVVVLLDCHSLFQVALGTCTWSIPTAVRPDALTPTILCCSLTCNIAAGIVISIGDHRTRKKDVLERIKRQELTTEALGRMQQKHMNEPLGEGIGQELRKKSMADAERVQTPPEHQAVPALIEPGARKSMDVGRGRKSMDGRRSLDVSRKSLDASRGRKSMEAGRSMS